MTAFFEMREAKKSAKYELYLSHNAQEMCAFKWEDYCDCGIRLMVILTSVVGL